MLRPTPSFLSHVTTYLMAIKRTFMPVKGKAGREGEMPVRLG